MGNDKLWAIISTDEISTSNQNERKEQQSEGKWGRRREQEEKTPLPERKSATPQPLSVGTPITATRNRRRSRGRLAAAPYSPPVSGEVAREVGGSLQLRQGGLQVLVEGQEQDNGNIKIG
jgi:hypothetical protein